MANCSFSNQHLIRGAKTKLTVVIPNTNSLNNEVLNNEQTVL